MTKKRLSSRIKKEKECCLERLVKAGYTQDNIEAYFNKFYYDLTEDYVVRRQKERHAKYKEAFSKISSKLPMLYAQRFWPEEKNRQEQIESYLKIMEGIAPAGADYFSSDWVFKAIDNCMNLSLPEIERTFENFMEKSQEMISIISDKKFLEDKIYQIPEEHMPSLIKNLKEHKVEFSGKILGNERLPTDYVIRLLGQINRIEQSGLEYFKGDTSKFFPAQFHQEYFRKFHELLEKETPKIELYGHIERILEELGKSIIDNKDTEVQKNLEILTKLSVSEIRLLQSEEKPFQPVELETSINFKRKEKRQCSDKIQIDAFYRTGKISNNMRRYFNDSEIKLLQNMRDNPRIMNNINKIINEGEGYKRLIEIETEKMMRARETVKPDKDRSIKINNNRMSAASYSIYDILNTYEKKEQAPIRSAFRWPISSELYYPSKNKELLDFNTEDMRFWSRKFSAFKRKICIEEDINLKILHYIKKEASDKFKDKELAYKIQELERVLVEKVEAIRSEHDQGINTEPEFAKVRFRTPTGYTQEYYNNSVFSRSSFDCLEAGGKYAIQGLTFLDNSRSIPLQLERKTKLLAYKFDNINEYYMIGRSFLYDANVDVRKCLFVAGLSGSDYLNDLSGWTDKTISIIHAFAIKNKYHSIYFNINPVGDIRDSDTRYSHEFAKAVADACDIPESEYTYQKLGSGRKPRFFQLTKEAKEKYTKHIKVTRDPNLVGTFFVEGMFGTREEAVNSGISLNPEKDNFKPYFFESEGYAPVIEYKIK
ncbi:MAG: hypothetical protein ACP5OA_04235 [Candidatus Woesearchaeota archaeon]